MNGMQQGLGGITAGSMPRMTETATTGATKQSMEQIMEAARKLSDAQLADVLAGKSMEVPQFVAMSEAMGRKQLRTAMQGAQAQQQGQQPSIREQLLAETAAQAAPPIEQGIGALPAPNMEQMEEMAGGGIVAFDNGGDVKEWWEYEAAGETPPDTGSFWSGLGRAFTYSSDVEAMKQRQQQQEAALDQAVNEAPAEVKPVDVTGQLNKPPVQQRQPAPVSIAEETEAVADTVPDRFAQFQNDGSALEKTLEEQREQTQGEFLMQIGASLLGSPTVAEGLSSGVQKALPFLVSNKREANKLRQDARDFNFNVAKAQEAAELGDADMAYKYEALAAEKAYRAGLLATKGTTGGINTKSLFTEANKRISEKLKDPLFARQYGNMTPEQKQQLLQNEVQQVMQLAAMVSGTGGMMPQGGLNLDSLSAAAEEEYQKRFSGD
jgi:hypothetical protein